VLPTTALFGEMKVIKAAIVYDGIPRLFAVRCDRGYELMAVELPLINQQRRWLLAPHSMQGIYDVMTGVVSVREAFERPTLGHIVYTLDEMGHTEPMDARSVPDKLKPGYNVSLAITEKEAKAALGIPEPYAIDDPRLTTPQPMKTGRKKSDPMKRAVVLSVLSPRVRELREQRGWSQEELAEKSGVTLSTIVRLETSKTQYLPGLETIMALATAFRVPVASLLPE